MACGRVGLALLKTAEDTLLELPFERLLTALNSKQFPAFSRPPAQLLKLALSFRVRQSLSMINLLPISKTWQFNRNSQQGL